MRQEFSRSFRSGSPRRTYDGDIVSGVVFPVRAAGAQGEEVALAIVLVRLVPGINANYPRKITWVTVINDHRMLVGNDIEAALAAIQLPSVSY